MNRIKLSFLLFIAVFLFSIQIKAQEFMFNGVVFETGTKIRIALCEVSNLRNNYSVGTNDMGLFTIRAVIGDTLVISKRGFDDKKIVVTSTQSSSFYLNRGNTLKEVVINGTSQKQALDDIKQDFKNKGSFYAGKPPFLAFLFQPLTALYETFGRTPKNARRFNNYYNTELQQTQIDRYFNRTIINQQTGLDGKDLDNFMINYRPDYEQAKNWNVYDGNKWIKESFKKYADTVGKKP